MVSFIIATIATKSWQADFTDVSVLPMIVQRLKEERVEVREIFSLTNILTVLYGSGNSYHKRKKMPNMINIMKGGSACEQCWHLRPRYSTIPN